MMLIDADAVATGGTLPLAGVDEMLCAAAPEHPNDISVVGVTLR